MKKLALALAAILCLFLFTPPAQAGGGGSTISGVDLHDGMVTQVGSTYYMYGTMYNCGFTWQDASTHFCGFGASSSTDMVHWSAPVQLFSPTSTDPFTGTTWDANCQSNGCFNPRMVQRSGWGANDGVWILAFNSPKDYARNGANAYNFMGCAGPLGPCGPGTTNGSYNKPKLYFCGENGDFALSNIKGSLYIYCTQAGTTGISVEKLDKWGTNSARVGARRIANIKSVEAPGVFWAASLGRYVMTYSDPNCGYCQGTGTAFATSYTPLGPWIVQHEFSAASCAGQPRTVFYAAGKYYEWIDLWTGSMAEAGAKVRFEPLTPTGGFWKPALAPYTC